MKTCSSCAEFLVPTDVGSCFRGAVAAFAIQTLFLPPYRGATETCSRMFRSSPSSTAGGGEVLLCSRAGCLDDVVLEAPAHLQLIFFSAGPRTPEKRNRPQGKGRGSRDEPGADLQQQYSSTNPASRSFHFVIFAPPMVKFLLSMPETDQKLFFFHHANNPNPSRLISSSCRPSTAVPGDWKKINAVTGQPMSAQAAVSCGHDTAIMLWTNEPESRLVLSRT